MNRLFVYGTLNPNDNMLIELGVLYSVVGKGSVKGKRIHDFEYPAIVPWHSDPETIEGIIIEIKNPDEAWKTLDDYEEFFPNHLPSSLYIRETTNVLTHQQEELECWIYWFNPNQTI